jgi:uncharacterized membrane protein
MSETASPFRHPITWLRNKFLAGVALAVPLVVTFWFLQFVYEFLQGMSEPLLRSFAGIYNQAVPAEWSIDLAGRHLVQMGRLLGFLVPIAALLALGVMATNVIGVRIVAALDRLVLSVPLISFIYKSLKQVIEAFHSFGGSRNFKRVVYVEYPSPGMRLIGFVTGHYPDPKTGLDMSCVFLPGALSPMTGLLIVVETTRLEDAPLTVEDAMKMIFSGGLISPGAGGGASRGGVRTAPVPQVVPGVKPPDYVHLPKAEDHPVEQPPATSGSSKVSALS